MSWGAYLESMPYTGYTAETGNSDLYYRKHNPLVPTSHPKTFWLIQIQISYQSVTANDTRMAHIKNLTMFYSDLDSGLLPQVSLLDKLLIL